MGLVDTKVVKYLLAEKDKIKRTENIWYGRDRENTKYKLIIAPTYIDDKLSNISKTGRKSRKKQSAQNK